MIKCNKCGRENEDHYKFCLGCGAPLEGQKPAAAAAPEFPSNCPSCNAAVNSSQRFCGGCGYNLADHMTNLAAEYAAAAAAAPPAATAPAPAPPVAAPVGPPPAAPGPGPTTSTSGAAVAAPAGAPMSTAGAAGLFVFVQPDGSPGEAFPLKLGDNLLGREVPFGNFQADKYLSARHANLKLDAGSTTISDLGTPNGVFVRINAAIELSHGAEIRIGRERLTFELLDQMAPLSAVPGDGTTLLGSPRGSAWGRLCRMSANNEASIVFVLRQDEHRLGREVGDILFPDDGYVSGRHARIFKDGDKVMLEDVGSSNGTFIRILQPTVIASNALVLLGEKPYRFVRAS